MDTTALVGAFFKIAGEVLAELKGQPIAEIDLDLLRLKRSVLTEALDDFKRDLAEKVTHEKSRVEQDMISRGLTASSVRLTFLNGIDRQAVTDTERAVREYNRGIEELALMERRIRELNRPLYRKVLYFLRTTFRTTPQE